eukprot:4961625-Prymnesium_polylepis.1
MDNCSHVLVPSQYGGGIYFNSGTLQLSTVVFSANNAANGGLALYFVNTPDDGSFLTDIVVRDHQSGQTVAVRAGATNFDTFNTFNCSAGHFGAANDLTDSSCSGPCPTGHYCLARTSTPTPCETGTYNPEEGASLLANCLQCSAGK